MPAYREQAAPPSFVRWVECIWSLETDVAVNNYPVAPDGCLDIIYDRGNSLRAVGAMSKERRFDISANTRLVGIRFRPGAARRFLGIPAAELTDSVVPLQDLWHRGASELKCKLDDAPSLCASAGIMLGSLNSMSRTGDAVQCAIEALVASNGNLDLDEMAVQANLSARQFRRRCAEETGLSPKLLSRILRFRHASELARRAGWSDWSGIAAAAGYFDQSHLIHDFRALTGRTPMSVFSNTQPDYFA